MPLQAWVSHLVFTGGSPLDFGPDDVIVIVGPNNAGKSEALRGIRSKLEDPRAENPVINSLEVGRSGTFEDLAHLFGSMGFERSVNGQRQFHAFGTAIATAQAEYEWNRAGGPLGTLSRFLCEFVNAEQRLTLANPSENFSVVHQTPSNPIQYLLLNDQLELRLSRQFRKAFDTDLVVHRNAGNQIPLYVGPRPIPQQGQDRLSVEYIREIEKLSLLQQQGDGMRAFAGLLLAVSVGSQTILLIDEPEAFLHPPQARYLGKTLVSDKPLGRQMFIATHSGDILRGVLDSGSANVRVVRIRRAGTNTSVTELNNERVTELWNDPLLRYSNVLDGVFHERVIVCESDADARFYAAVSDATADIAEEQPRRSDVMFTHCGGKDRIPTLVRALRHVDVPVSVISDFDVLNGEQPLRAIVEALGGIWTNLEKDWQTIRTSIDSKKPELSSAEVAADIDQVLRKIADPIFPKAARESIQKILRRSSPWSTAKTVGKPFVPNGEPTTTCERLLRELNRLGVFVVEVGEVEGFARSVGGHGPAWVNEVLKKDLRNDPELGAARDFVNRVVR